MTPLESSLKWYIDKAGPTSLNLMCQRPLAKLSKQFLNLYYFIHIDHL